MSAAQWTLFAISIASLGLLLFRGRTPERLAAMGFIVIMFGSPVVQGAEAYGIRWAVALLAFGLLITLTWLGIRWPRWWLLCAAGVQLLSIATYLVALLQPDTQLWASVSVRYVIWLQLMLLGLFGVFEARRAPYADPRNTLRG